MYSEMRYDNDSKISADQSVNELMKMIEMAEDIANRRTDLIVERQNIQSSVYRKIAWYISIALFPYFAIKALTISGIFLWSLVAFISLVIVWMFLDVTRTYKSLNSIQKNLVADASVLNDLHTLIDGHRSYLVPNFTLLDKKLIEMRLSRIAFHTEI